MNLAIIGTRGIPNSYGGFEELAEHISVGLNNKGYNVTVYNTSDHSYTKNNYKGVNIIKKYNPEKLLGSFGQFIYDFKCIIECRKKKFDVIIQLGYTSSAIWNWMFSKKSYIITNMDGLEWKRDKYSFFVKFLLKIFEKMAVSFSDVIISDNLEIKRYYYKKYKIKSTFISYGARLIKNTSENILIDFDLQPFEYDLIIARMEPENNIEKIITGYINSKVYSQNKRKLVVIGNGANSYSKYLLKKYKNFNNIIFMGQIFKKKILNNLRYYSNIYFHGHSVGGTNPSLIEAMSCKSFIIAHNNVFNKSVLGEDNLYFHSTNDISKFVDNVKKEDYCNIIENNYKKVQEHYNWEFIINKYEKLLKAI